MNQKTINIVLGGLVIILGVALIGMHLRYRNIKTTPASIQSNVDTFSSARTWKSYEANDGTLAYSVEYPADWNISQSTNTMSPSGKGVITYFSAPIKNADTTASLSVYEDAKSSEVVDKIKFQLGNTKDFKIVDGTVNGNNAQIITYAPEGSTNKQVIIQKGNLVFVLYGVLTDSNNAYLAISDHFFDSFRFTNLK